VVGGRLWRSAVYSIVVFNTFSNLPSFHNYPSLLSSIQTLPSFINYVPC
jgi:hypothetical protein